jgi:multidrug transporter EmrE-like cation transporter
MYIVWVLAAGLFFTAGGVSMKASVGMTRLAPTVLFFLFFAVGAAFQALALRNAELGVAYLVVLGLEAVLAVALGVVIFSEQVSVSKCLGVLAVVLGIALLHRGEPHSPGAPTATVAQSVNASATD